ncbi:hypothetical protein MXM82_10995 [Pseudomonas asiatica]|nr:hypothetical protein [Pseudomonas asiatica]MEB6589655.1 hypothetical protein [Pseudomonas asiatica]
MSKHKLDIPPTSSTTRDVIRKAFEAIQIPHAPRERARNIAGEEVLGLRQ